MKKIICLILSMSFLFAASCDNASSDLPGNTGGSSLNVSSNSAGPTVSRADGNSEFYRSKTYETVEEMYNDDRVAGKNTNGLSVTEALPAESLEIEGFDLIDAFVIEHIDPQTHKKEEPTYWYTDNMFRYCAEDKVEFRFEADLIVDFYYSRSEEKTMDQVFEMEKYKQQAQSEKLFRHSSSSNTIDYYAYIINKESAISISIYKNSVDQDTADRLVDTLLGWAEAYEQKILAIE